MKKFPIVLDLETKHSFREFSEHKKLGITVVGVYDYADDQGKTYLESDLNALFRVLENASYVIGYNINGFDFPVLQAYYPGNITQFRTFDICDEVKNKIGRRLALNELVSTTLGKKKSGHGLLAIEYYKKGQWDELKQYCLDDVMLTKELFDYGVKNGDISYLNENGKVKIPVDWKPFLENDEHINDTHLTLPF